MNVWQNIGVGLLMYVIFGILAAAVWNHIQTSTQEFWNEEVIPLPSEARFLIGLGGPITLPAGMFLLLVRCIA